MSDLMCLSKHTTSPPPNTRWFSSVLLHLIADLSQLCSLVLSHPLYFSSYFLVLFTPSQILTALTYLFPLLLTTASLFLLPHPAGSDHNSTDPLAVMKRLQRSKFIDDGSDGILDTFEGFEAYEKKIALQCPDEAMGAQENQVQFLVDQCLSSLSSVEDEDEDEDEMYYSSEEADEESNAPTAEAMEGCHTETPKSRNYKSHKAASFPMRSRERKPTVAGKMTLGWRMYEERRCSGEGMDLLWEMHETESIRSIPSPAAIHAVEEESMGDQMRKSKKRGDDEEMGTSRSSSYSKESDDDEREMVMMDELCCLQALKKLSAARKVNMGGMGKSNLKKISKAIKGIGWFNHLGKRHRKKQVVHIEDNRLI
ncbi:unnamed protein product [Cuscuta epithymum]|uniref:Uncharacterized protein n=1 Tax=Cuscuta epithymum TaxID=186058 RepID=A0AAV0FSZ2_9ASTE|nr:unnamed protein product [Cuscuta epithymum]